MTSIQKNFLPLDNEQPFSTALEIILDAVPQNDELARGMLIRTKASARSSRSKAAVVRV